MVGSHNSTLLEHICCIDDIFERHLVHYFTATDVARLEATNKALRHQLLRAGSAGGSGGGGGAWQILCQRDFVKECVAPVGTHTNDMGAQRQSFDKLESFSSYKLAYAKWRLWEKHTHKAAKASDMVRAVRVWDNFKNWLRQSNLDSVLNSLCPCPSSESFQELAAKNIPSSFAAFLSVHGGQMGLTPRSSNGDFFAGALGGYTCYNSFYSMRLVHVARLGAEALFPRPNVAIVGLSPGNPRYYLHLNWNNLNDPEGSLVMSHNGQSDHVIARGGILSYFATFVDRLRNGMYSAGEILPDCRSISLFPDAGDTVSCVVTQGIEVRASARWFPGNLVQEQQGGGLNFGYSVRIRLVGDADDAFRAGTTCQLVGRHWHFTDGNGRVRHVDGEGVIGKQPLFFRDNNGNSGFVDLGPGGDGDRYPNKVFSYQSQSGPVAGTSQESTGSASVQGTFSFVRGSIENAQGPIFHVAVGPFPLSISLPFY